MINAKLKISRKQIKFGRMMIYSFYNKERVGQNWTGA